MTLAQYLVQNGIKQVDLAKILKVNQSSINKWLYKKSLPSGKHMIQIFDITKGQVNLKDWK